MLRTRMRMIEKDGKDDENDEDDGDGDDGVDDVDDVGAGEHNQPAVGQHLLL